MTYLDRLRKTLKSRPLVIGTATGHGPLDQQLRLARSSGVDLLELRLDTFPNLPFDVRGAINFSKEMMARIKKLRLPILLTLRSHTESGTSVPRARQRSDSWRAALLEPLLDQVDLIDLEISRDRFARPLAKSARRLGVNTILSYHNFKSTPAVSKLDSLARSVGRLRGDILKIAGRVSSDDELRSFLRWGKKAKGRVALIGMGAVGLPSRLIGYSFGSILTYGHLGKSAAPGQIPARDLVKAIRSIYG